MEIRNGGAASVDLSVRAAVRQRREPSGTLPDDDLPAVDLGAGGYYVVCGNPATVAECDLDDGTRPTDLIQNGAPDAVRSPGRRDRRRRRLRGRGARLQGGRAGRADGPATDREHLARPRRLRHRRQRHRLHALAGTPGASNPGRVRRRPGRRPAVADVRPGDGDADVDRDANVRVTFTEPVTAADARSRWPATARRRLRRHGEARRLHPRPAADAAGTARAARCASRATTTATMTPPTRRTPGRLQRDASHRPASRACASTTSRAPRTSRPTAARSSPRSRAS